MRIRYLLGAIVLLLSVGQPSMSDNLFLSRNKIKYSDDTYYDSDDEEEEEYNSILLQYEDDFFDPFLSDEEIESDGHRDFLRQYYSERNQDVIESLSFLDFIDVSSFEYGPFIQLKYVEMECLAVDLNVLKGIEGFVAFSSLNMDFTESSTSGQTVNTKESTENYPFADALTDVGVSKPGYDGTGIKIGCLYDGIPRDYTCFKNTKYHTFGTFTVKECSWLASVFGGSKGIAPGAELYFAPTSEISILKCVSWMVDNNVDIIYQDKGSVEANKYDAYSAFTDYVSYHFGITYVAGPFKQRRTTTLALSANAMIVRATSANQRVIYGDNLSLDNSCPLKAKPNLVAPGELITGLEERTIVSGSRYAAGFVTGIIALLMQEFPSLRRHPESMISLLQVSARQINDQTTIFDKDAGFGMVNYQNARNIYNQTFGFSSDEAVSNGSILYESDLITLEPNQRLSVNAFLLEESAQKSPDDSLQSQTFRSIKAIVVEQASLPKTTKGIVLGNTSYLMVQNNSTEGEEKNYQIKILANEDWDRSMIQRGSVSYRILDSDAVSENDIEEE